MPAETPFNLILITADQFRGDCLGCAGHPAVKTPYLDELASRGARFSRAYSSVPICTPGRAAILTGMDPWNHGRLTMTGSDYLAYPATLPGELAGAGYHTQGVGKMHFFPQRALYGFHRTVLDEEDRRLDGFCSDYEAWFDENKEGAYGFHDHGLDWNSWVARPSHLPEHLHVTHWTASQGIDFIETRDPTRPFFLWLSFARPHPPFDPPQRYFDLYRDDSRIPAPVVGDWAAPLAVRDDSIGAAITMRNPDEVRQARAAYYGNITFMDHQIGRLINHMRRYQPDSYRRTFFLFTSDHGEMLGDHHHWRKGVAYEGSARVPMTVAYPGGWDLPRGEVYDEPVELRDVMPTLLDAGGVTVPPSVDGASLLHVARGEAAAWRAFIQGEQVGSPRRGDRSMQYITDGREKYIWFHYTGAEQFFDLEQDPMEARNLAADANADIEQRIQRWRQRLATVNEERGDPRGRDGRLVVQSSAVPPLTPMYHRWRERADRGLHPGDPD